ncbi:hypothetical protein Cgig2_022347 [Carnegiea gigantea]|uniref:Reverse transcriptase zinc-binding domain-containing protein n=1 Tax=Carnegiea gigantea TaxID=171969 RepID=A0A9Q1KGJ4_9CARY|nr:hypothetical protein Cgig2_022347 [Carnegiea gigantea]
MKSSFTVKKGGPLKLKLYKTVSTRLGYEFTWSNRSQVGEFVEERLDCFCALVEWMTLFSSCKVSHLDEDISYHLPILLHARDKVAGDQDSTSWWRFEVIWAEDNSEAVQNCALKIEHCLNALLKWNTKEFGNVQKQIGTLQNQLKIVSDATERALILGEVWDWRCKEEFGDQNSSWFCSKASARKVVNNISGLRARDDSWVVDIQGMRDIIWRVGDGFSLNVWECKWIPRPNSFRVITPFNPNLSLLRVGDLIDGQLGVWKEDMVRSIFLQMDVDVILKIPFSQNWPPDKPIWHFSSSGDLTVRSVYHFIMQSKEAQEAGGSGGEVRMKWKAIWGLPHRIPNFSIRCNICGRFEESDMHALVECPLAGGIWESSKFASFFTNKSYVSRERNKVAHSLTHFQPYDPSLRVWLDDIPDVISYLVLKDISSME